MYTGAVLQYLCRPTVAGLSILHDPVTTRWISDDRGGFVEETAIQVSRAVVAGVEVIDATLTPGVRGGKGDGGCHDTP